jgi:hypothetical protein
MGDQSPTVGRQSMVDFPGVSTSIGISGQTAADADSLIQT